MRQTIKTQLALGATPIESIVFNARSRDDIPKILMGLQHIYVNQALRSEILQLLESTLSKKVDFHNGRPGMDLWVLFVLGSLRVGLNCDYDRLHELANEHKTVRAMLGHGSWSDEFQYSLQTLRDNITLLTEEVLEKINVIVVNAGHTLIKKKKTKR